jgi:hypothetical protein
MLMASEDDLVVGCDAAGLGLRAAERFFHWTCSPRMSRTRDGGHGFRSPLLSWSWIASKSRRLFAVQSVRARINYLLNLSLFGCITAVIFSGILISKKAIPMLIGKQAAPDMDWRWDALHHEFSFAVVILAGFHLAINWDWVLAAGQRIFRRVQEDAL